LPRNFLTQGVLSGSALAAGYGLGVFGVWLCAYMELPPLNGNFLRIVKHSAATGCAIVAGVSLWQAAPWQNSIRELMDLEPIDTAYPLEISLIALTAFATAIALARFLRLTFRFVTTRVNRFLPGRMSNVIGVIAAAAFFWSVINGVLFRTVLSVAEAFFQEYDALIEPGTAPPMAPLKRLAAVLRCSPGTNWEGAGREFISSGPTREDINAFTGRNAVEPIRVYVGLDRQTHRKCAPSLHWKN
jgi:uncharacterized membrane protein